MERLLSANKTARAETDAARKMASAATRDLRLAQRQLLEMRRSQDAGVSDTD